MKWVARYWRHITERAKSLLGLERPHVSTRKWNETLSFQLNLSIHTRTRLRRIDYEIKTFENNLFSLFLSLFLLLFCFFVVWVCFFFKTTSNFKSTKFVTQVITSSLRGKKRLFIPQEDHFHVQTPPGSWAFLGQDRWRKKLKPWAKPVRKGSTALE